MSWPTCTPRAGEAHQHAPAAIDEEGRRAGADEPAGAGPFCVGQRRSAAEDGDLHVVPSDGNAPTKVAQVMQQRGAGRKARFSRQWSACRPRYCLENAFHAWKPPSRSVALRRPMRWSVSAARLDA